MSSIQAKTYVSNPSQKLAFIGLGVMGYPMAAHLLASGHQVTVYNRTAAKATQWMDEFGANPNAHVAATPSQAAHGADIVFTCVGNDEDLKAVILGEGGALAGMHPGSVLVDHTTASAQIARELFLVCQRHQIAFIDAPVSGGQAGAQNGQLTVMCGGNESDFLEVIGKGAAQSWQLDNRGKTMVQDQFDFGFAVDWMRKDLGIVLAEAHRNGARLPVTALVDQFYADVQHMGGHRFDTSSLIKRLQ